MDSKLKDKFITITQQLAEVSSPEDLEQLLKVKDDPVVYWGTATTGKPHLGYFVPIYKISDFLQAGCHVTILFADLHAYLDNMKSDWELLAARCRWYEFIIKEMLKMIGVSIEKLKFIRGTDYQLSREYTLDMYKLSALVTTEHTKKAGAEVVKQASSPLMSSLLYPILQALDEQYLGVDIQFGGVDQRKIFMFAKEVLPKIGYKKRVHLMNPLIPGLGQSGKMSSSEPLSKVDFDDTVDDIKSKLNKAYSIDGVSDGNGLLAILQYILFRYLQKQNRKFIVPRPEKFGGEMQFSTFEEVKTAFEKKELGSVDLKLGVSNLLIEFMAPLQKVIQENQELLHKAYPSKSAEVKMQEEEGSITSLDIKIGKIVHVEKHSNADGLFVTHIELGEEKPRTIVTGLVRYMPAEALKDKVVPVVCNLAPAAMRGVVSEGMILTVSAKKDNAQLVELLSVPEGVAVGERVTFEGEQGEPDSPHVNKVTFQKLIKHLHTNKVGEASFKEKAFLTSKGKLTSSLVNATVS